jgi:hypothetical protein
VSVPTAEVRAWLREEGIPFLDPDGDQGPSLQEVEAAAERIVGQAQGRAVALGVASGLAGAVAIPPEILATLVHVLRLSQRLAVMFGFDPETDRGRVLLWRALAAAYEVELPSQGSVGVRVRDLPEVVRAQLPATRQASLWLTRQVFWRSVMTAAGRVIRVVPGLGAGIAGWSGYRRTAAMGRRMIAVYRGGADAVPWELGDEEAAIEVPPPRPGRPS